MLGNIEAAEIIAKLSVQSTSGPEIGRILHAANKGENSNTVKPVAAFE